MGVLTDLLARAGNAPNPGHLVAQGANQVLDPAYPVDAAIAGYMSRAPIFQPTIGGMLGKTATDLGESSTGFLKSLMAGDYEAAMNSSLFPMGAMTVYRGSPNVVPAKESLREVADSNFSMGIPSGDKTVSIDSLNGGMSSATTDAAKVKSLVKKMSGAKGYIERLIVDQHGNVIEGQHRLNALRAMGVKEVPVSVIADHSDTYDALVAGGLRPEHARNVIENVSEMLGESGSAAKVRADYEFPKGYESAFDTALERMAVKDGAAKATTPWQLYHGTGKQFTDFSLDAPKSTLGGFSKHGVSLSPDKAVAARYAKDFGGDAGRVMTVEAGIEKPLNLTAAEFEKLQSLVSKLDAGVALTESEDIGVEMLFKKHGIPFTGAHPIESIKSAGFDAISKDAGRHGAAEMEVLVFDPTKLKTK